MKYIISNLVNKKWQDKDFTESTLESISGEVIDKVSDWTGTIKENGQKVEGEIIKNEKGYYRFMLPKTEKSNFRSQQIEKAVERKEKSISGFQESKNESIILSATFRDATLMTTTQINKMEKVSEKEMEEMWLRWRTWLVTHWGEKLSDIVDPF